MDEMSSLLSTLIPTSMKLRQKQIIDFWLGSILLLSLRPIARFLGWISRRDHGLDIRGPVMIIKLQGGGSLLIAYPALLAIRQSNPSTKFVLLTTNGVKPFAELMGLFDEIFVINDRNFITMIESVARIILRTAGKVDTVIDLEIYSRLSTVVALFTCARNRISAYLEDIFLREWIATHLIFFNRYAPVYTLYKQISDIFSDRPCSYAEAKTRFRESLVGRGVANFEGQVSEIVILPTCSELGTERMLSPALWVSALSNHLESNKGLTIGILGTQSDYHFTDALTRLLEDSFPSHTFRNYSGKTTLLEASNIILNSKVVYSIDSGLLHVARLLDKAVVSFWGPTDPKLRLIDCSEKETIRYSGVICSPCVHVAERPPCGGRNLCIQSLFEDVTERDLRDNITIQGVLRGKIC